MTSSPWTEEDRALMLAWGEYQASICSGCGHPKATAWHHLANEEWWQLDGSFVCMACTAAQKPGEGGKREPVKYPVVKDVRDYDDFPLPGPPQPQI